MNLKYKIVEVNPASHSIVVRFYTDTLTEDALASQLVDGEVVRCRTDYSIDLPVPAPQGDALKEFITARAPKEWLKTQEALLNPATSNSLTALDALLQIETVVPGVPPPHNSATNSRSGAGA